MANQSQSMHGETVRLFPWLTPMNAVPDAALKRTTELWVESARAWQQEVTRFTTERLQKDTETSRQFLASKDWGEMAKLHQQWLASTAHDYAELMGRLSETAKNFGTELSQAAGAAARESAEATRSASRDKRYAAE